MTFELTRQFDGKPVECVVLLWYPRFESKQDNVKMLTQAPKSTTILGVGLEGEWKPKPFLIDPKQGALRIGTEWILISDIDAASQFAVEKEHAVAFPHETKKVYVSGHVGLHLHVESTGEAYTLAFPGFELADVSFDAVNRLSYDMLSEQIFRDDDAAGEEGEEADLEQGRLMKLVRKGGAKKKAAAAAAAAAAVAHAGGEGGEAAAQHAAQHGHDEVDDDEYYVAQSGTELIQRGKMVNVNEFTQHFLEGGGMGSLADADSSGSGGKGNAGAPNDGMLLLRKETGSHSTWIARMEEGDDDHVYLMKLSKALIKAPLNKIIKASPPSVARHFGPVVALSFQDLTIRSETLQPQFVLEEFYTALNGDKRVHRLICVFTNLEERVRWEDWLQSHGVKKKSIDPATLKKAGSDASGANQGEEAGGERAASRGKQIDTTMKLINECFAHDEVWEKHHPHGDGSEEDDDEDDLGYEEDESSNPFVADTPRYDSAMTTPRGGTLSLSGKSSPLSSPRSAGSSLSPTGSGRAGSKGRKKNSKNDLKKDPSAAAALASEPTKDFEQEQAENEALDRCRWFSGYTAPKGKNRWSALADAVNKEKTAGVDIFAAAKALKSDSMVFAQSQASFRGDSMDHIPQQQQQSPSKNALAALIRARALTKTMSAAEKAKQDASGESGDQSSPSSPGSPATAEAVADLDRVEAEATRMAGESNYQDPYNQQQQQFSTIEGGSSSRNVILPKKLSSAPPHNANNDISYSTSVDNMSPIHRSNQSSVNANDAAFAAAGGGGGGSSSDGYSAMNSQLVNELQRQRSTGDAPYSPQSNRISSSSSSSQPQQQQDLQQTGGRRGKKSSSSHLDLPSDGSMFGKPHLFGPLPPKFPSEISLRSEGFVGQQDIQFAVNRRDNNLSSSNSSSVSSSASGISPVYRFDSQEEDAINRSSTKQRRYSGNNSGGSSSYVNSASPAANSARDFSFSYGQQQPQQHHDQSHQQQQQQQQQQQPQTQKRYNVQTSSDDEDEEETNRRFNDARAMRAVMQFGEELVGISQNSGKSNNNNYNNSGSTRMRNSGGSSSSSSSPASMSGGNSLCPLCQADRNSVAICKKTGRLHANNVPHYAS